MHGEKDEHFVMDLKQVKNKLAKVNKKVDANKIFDYSHKEGTKVKTGKKQKKEDPNKMQMSFYNLRSKKYTKENK
jgi:6-pyruvoyl-tetrahydropterin synthase